jgi:hypothetical protein
VTILELGDPSPPSALFMSLPHEGWDLGREEAEPDPSCSFFSGTDSRNPTTLTRSLCRGSSVNHRAMAQRCPLVTAFTPCGFSVPEENPTALPHWGCTSAYIRDMGSLGARTKVCLAWLFRVQSYRSARGAADTSHSPWFGVGTVATRKPVGHSVHGTLMLSAPKHRVSVPSGIRTRSTHRHSLGI